MALTPLWAFGNTLERQRACQGENQKAQAWFEHMKAALGEELENITAQARLKVCVGTIMSAGRKIWAQRRAFRRAVRALESRQ